MEEIWKDVVGYEDYFQVSNTGKIFSKRTNKELKQTLSRKGYCIFSTRFDGKNSKAFCFRVHRLVAKAFIENSEGKPFVNHIDGIKTNNHVDNLEWVTASENVNHAFGLGLAKARDMHGEKNARSILTNKDVELIREIYKGITASKVLAKKKLAEDFGVSYWTICGIVYNTKWKL